MSLQPTFLGIDVGAVSLALCELSAEGAVEQTAYRAHRGNIRALLAAMLSEIDLSRVGWVGTAGSAANHVRGGRAVDAQLAHIAAVRSAHPDVGSIIVIGGERFSIIRFDEQGRYRGTQTNSSCAAGTGSFLDQYARTLGFDDGARLAEAALGAGEVAPPIASRCAVFAKTDLIHAQQQGYSREAICNGLCDGLAAIVADTVLSGPPLRLPVVLSGGVALNRAVRHHLARRLGCELAAASQAHLDAALGAALVLREEVRAEAEAGSARPGRWQRPEDLVAPQQARAVSLYPPLGKPSAGYPRFDDHPCYTFTPKRQPDALPVEVDSYVADGGGEGGRCLLGVDVGSTSTKAALLDGRRRVLVGVYTRTAGRPIVAVQALLEALEDWLEGQQPAPRIQAVATTGAGRKLVGAVVGADLVIDEITAHARAATELCPDVDTIIEIGGQDAKFTTLRRGRVTSASMNTVCAAGTGSFVEEQAKQLGCGLGDYGQTVAESRAPWASDRCTVFMQRDIGHLLGGGFSVPEVLGSVLHSVRDNYLQRVAREASLGERICFQGATAKNPALVAAFEQRLGRPIAVSRYCHLTGALGAALLLADQPDAVGRFRGLGLARRPIATTAERCELCRNRCVITTATVEGQRVAYGFRCGRDLDTEAYVSANRSGFDLIKARRAAERRLAAVSAPSVDARRPTVGIPAALQLFDQLPFWRRFFGELGVRVVTSQKLESPVTRGKRIARAEFCAPMTAFHAHVASLAERADFVFAPTVLEGPRPDRHTRRQYCYYSQYASALVASSAPPAVAERLLTPLVSHLGHPFPSVGRISAALRPVLGDHVSRVRVARAFRRAHQHARLLRAELEQMMSAELADGGDELAVVLLGRPYCCLAPQMNKGIPDIIGALGVKAFFQDMLAPSEEDAAEIADLLQTVHWHFAAEILTAACTVAKTPGLYPVLVQSFKCAPDSCVAEYVKRIFDRYDKPFLVLELDEHDSALGYETRIEAGIAAFRNHHAAPRRARPSPRPVTIHYPPSSTLGDRTLFLPRWDEMACSLLTANLNRVGVRTVLLDETPAATEKAMRLNSGQCSPLTIIAQEFIDAVEERGLDPGKAALWTLESQISCNLGMFASAIRSLLAAHGRGFERAAVYVGEISMVDLTVRGSLDTYFAYMLSGYLRRLACRTRPYEREAGSADRAVAAGMAALRDAFAGKRSKLEAVAQLVDRFAAIEVSERDRPKVAIFGDFFSRDNDTQNQGLVRFIEQHGGEVVTTPYSEYMKLVAESYFRKWMREGKVLDVVVSRSLLATALRLERRFAAEFSRVLGPEPSLDLGAPVDEVLAPFGITPRHTGESFDNLIKVAALLRHEPDLSLFVQANPAFCCPSLVTEAMAARIEEHTGIPVVTVTYDGSPAPKNDVIVPYLEFARTRGASERRRVTEAPVWKRVGHRSA